MAALPSGRSDAALFFAGGSGGAGSNTGVATPRFFFPFIVFFLPFGFVLFILTADPVSFARFLRKPISSLHTLTAFVSEILLVRTISA